MSFLVVCLNPTIQKTYEVEHLTLGEVNRVRRRYVDASGKGVNVARVLRQLGESQVHITHAGGRDKQRFLEMCDADGVVVRSASCRSEIRTGTTLLDVAEGTTTEIVEEADPVDPPADDEVLAIFDDALDDAHTVIISGSKAAGYQPDIFATMTRRAIAEGKRVILDIRGTELRGALPWRPTVIKPNLKEFVATFLPDYRAVSEEEDDGALLDAVRAHMRRIADAGTAVILSRGAKDVLYTVDGRVESAPAKPVRARNTIGCGDAFAAGLGQALARGANIGEAVAAAIDVAARNAAQVRPGRIAE